MRIAAWLPVFVVLCCGVARAGDSVYVRNIAVPQPRVERAGDVFVPAATLVRLFDGAVGADGSVPGVSAIVVKGLPYYPVLATARAIGWEVKRQADLGIVDVIRPTKERLASVQRQNVEVPVDARELAVAEYATQAVVQELGPLVKGVSRVETIGRRVAAASTRPDLKWTFYVVDSEEINALSVGAGRVFVTTGLLARVDDAELAGVLAHEVAHTCCRHSTQAMDDYQLMEMYVKQAEEAHRAGRHMDEEDAMAKAEAIAARLVQWRTVQGWDQEYEADRLGMRFLSTAGYHPLVMVTLLEKLQQIESASEPLAALQVEGASTHPPLRERIRIAREVLDHFFQKR